jgi:methylmalonyl-CoA mutase N-terminal domain/subunit
MGGAVCAIESGFVQNQIEEAAYAFQRAIDTGDRVIVGVNAFRQAEEAPIDTLEPDPELERQQCERLASLRAERDNSAVEHALRQLEEAARGTDNLMYPLKQALAAYATIGEVSDILRRTFGTYRPTAGI